MKVAQVDTDHLLEVGRSLICQHLLDWKRMQELIKKITRLTNLLKTKYPEYYRYLDENPMTLPTSEDPNVSQEALKAYLESLRSLLKHTEERQHKRESKTLQP